MINDITFAIVKQHQQELLDQAADLRLGRRLARRTSTRISLGSSLATKWNRLRHARTHRPASQPQVMRPATSCSAH